MFIRAERLVFCGSRLPRCTFSVISCSQFRENIDAPKKLMLFIPNSGNLQVSYTL